MPTETVGMRLWPAQISTALALVSRRAASRRRLAAVRDRQLRALVTHAYAHVPYYRRLFDRHGILPGHIRTAADLRHIPVTTKDDLRATPLRDLIAEGIEPASLSMTKTSGSSGEPLATYRTSLESRLTSAFFLRAMHSFGLRMTDRRACVTDVPGTGRADPGLLRRLLAGAAAGRLMVLNCLRPASEIIDALRRYRPQFLHGYAGAIGHVAEAMTIADRRAMPLRAVMIGGDSSTPEMRRQIEVAFGAPVYSVYGSQELGLIASECRRSGELHTCDDGVVVEVLRNGRPAAPGERGDLVGTSLYFYAMPFIRYRQGDLVMAGSAACICGRSLRTVHDVAGRTTEYLALPNGRRLHPYRITDVIIAQADWVRRHQVVQESADTIALHVIPAGRPDEAEIRRVERAVREVLPEGVAFRIDMVDAIERDAAGKYPMARPLPVR